MEIEYITGSIAQLRNRDIDHVVLKSYCMNRLLFNEHRATDGIENEFILMIKPEMFSGIDTGKMLSVVHQTLAKHGVELVALKMMNWAYTRKMRVFENYYLTLNRGALKGYRALNHSEKEYACKIGISNIICAYEILELIPEITSLDLERAAHSGCTTKIANGSYITPFEHKGVHYNVLNSFHPCQIETLNSEGGLTAVLVCRTNGNYNEIADKMIGHYKPIEARKGSLRRYFYDHQHYFQLTIIDTLRNGFHNSPSPLEAMFDICHAFDLESISSTSLGNLSVVRGIPNEFLEWLKTNPQVITRNKCSLSIFEYLEHRCSNDIIDLLIELEQINEYPCCKR